MTYHLTLSNNSVNVKYFQTQFTNTFNPPLEIKPNSYIQVNNIYIKKDNSFSDPEGIFIYIPQLTSMNTYNCNQSKTTQNGYLCSAMSFDGFNLTSDDIINDQLSNQKIPINNETKLILNDLTIDLRQLDNSLFDEDNLLNVSISITITDKLELLS